jgi:hypothetical protein
LHAACAWPAAAAAAAAGAAGAAAAAVVAAAAARLRQMVALGHTDELQAELGKFKAGAPDLRKHLEKVSALHCCVILSETYRTGLLHAVHLSAQCIVNVQTAAFPLSFVSMRTV